MATADVPPTAASASASARHTVVSRTDGRPADRSNKRSYSKVIRQKVSSEPCVCVCCSGGKAHRRTKYTCIAGGGRIFSRMQLTSERHHQLQASHCVLLLLLLLLLLWRPQRTEWHSLLPMAILLFFFHHQQLAFLSSFRGTQKSTSKLMNSIDNNHHH